MRDKILIVDDIEINREILAAALGDMYTVVEAADGECAIKILEQEMDEIGGMLLDLIMPKMDGYQVLEYMNKRHYQEMIPVLVISAESQDEVEHKCLELGVSDFIRKPFDSITVRRRVRNIMELYQYKRSLEEKVRVQTSDLKRKNRQLKQQAEKIQASNEKIIDVLGTVVEYRNLESGEHIKRVKGFTKILAHCAAENYPEYGLTPERIDVIVSASPLHDIGKITISDTVLLKPGKLTAEEFEEIKKHTTRGCDILEKIDDAWDSEYAQVCYNICRHHHEKYDGRGYPDGLVGEQIPIEAQLVSVADVYDALVSERVYKKAIDKERAFQMILDGECGAFSDKMMDCFRKVKPEFEKLATEYQEEA